MGTGGYYYTSAEHWLIDRTRGDTYFKCKKLMEIEGRLTKEIKQKMIELSK